MAKQKLTVTLPDGTVATRTTDHTYTHVLIARRVATIHYTYPVVNGRERIKSERVALETPEWMAVSWHHTQAAAVKAMGAKIYASVYDAKNFDQAQVVPVPGVAS